MNTSCKLFLQAKIRVFFSPLARSIGLPQNAEERNQGKLTRPSVVVVERITNKGIFVAVNDVKK